MEKYVRGKEQEWSGMKPKIQRAFGGAMARMAMIGPSQIVPEQERQEGDDFAEALASADKAEPFSDIENDKENPKRFVPLIDYLKKLHTKLERYPETPMPQ
jgi:polyhydroxyalkanoate synthesis regulator protein